MTDIYVKEGVCKTWREDNMVLVSWETLSEAEFVKESCLKQLEEVKKGAKYVIIDTANTKGVVSQETQKWFGETLFPQMNAAGLKAIITILPQNAITKLASKHWKKTGAPFGFEMFETDSMENAKKLASEQ